jgi:hypothetical protein
MLAKPDFLPEDTRFAEFERFFASSRRRDAQVIIPHHETFSTSIQPPYSSTKG